MSHAGLGITLEREKRYNGAPSSTRNIQPRPLTKHGKLLSALPIKSTTRTSHFERSNNELTVARDDVAGCMQEPTSLNIAASSAAAPKAKRTKGRVKIKMQLVDNRLRRQATFSKRKTNLLKKAYELHTLTGSEVMVVVASETGHVYTYATPRLQPMIADETGKSLIQTCLSMTPSKQLNNTQSFSGKVDADIPNLHSGKIHSINVAGSGKDNNIPVTIPTKYFSVEEQQPLLSVPKRRFALTTTACLRGEKVAVTKVLRSTLS